MAKKSLPSSAVNDQLNQLLADLTQLQTNLQQTHWYMRGPEFFHLHPLMDDYKAQLAEQLDTLAERLIALGGSPLATTHEFSEQTNLPDKKINWGEFDLPELMDRLLKQFKYLKNQYQIAIKLTDQAQDFPTQDILNGYQSDLDKIIWMISAFLNQDPLKD